MSVSQQLDNLIKEIKLYLRYAVPENEIAGANAVVDRYKNQPLVLHLLRQYYVALPDAREEPATGVSKLVQRQGITLFLLNTPATAHLYAAATDDIVWLGEYTAELDAEVLAFWGFVDQQEFIKLCNEGGKREGSAADTDGSRCQCPACGVEEGEYHLLGCSVEVCPWCMGQLNKCNCRFEQLEVEVVDTEEQLERLLELLMTKGRVPFERNQAPYYPGTSDGLDSNDKEF